MAPGGLGCGLLRVRGRRLGLAVFGLVHLAEAAATGLYLLTGAELVEEAFIPEEIDEDELFEDELEAYRQGELPTRPDGEPYGTTIERLSQDPDTWTAWWNEHRGEFQRGWRYRLGGGCTPMSLIRTIQAERLLRTVRQWAYEELVIRYRMDVPFETDMWVADQKRALSRLQQQVEEKGRNYRAGKWYFAGHLMRQ